MAQAKSESEVRPRGRPPTRSDEETTRIVLEAAQHTFAVEGYAATSTEELARRGHEVTVIPPTRDDWVTAPAVAAGRPLEHGSVLGGPRTAVAQPSHVN